MKRAIVGALCAVLMAACGGPAASGGSNPTKIAASDSAITYQGRFDWDESQGPTYELAGSAISVGFTGTSAKVRLRELVSGVDEYGELRRNRYDVTIDGQPQAVLEPEQGEHLHTLAEGLPEGDHQLRLFKRTEPWIGGAQLMGLELDEGAKVKPLPRPDRRIEFIGDSVAVGLGVEGADENCDYSARLQNHAAAFPSLVASQLNAEHIAVAASGVGVSINYEGNTDSTMPIIYPRARLTQVSSHWNFEWRPQAVVVELGASDFQHADPGRTAFVTAYTSLLEKVRAVYPDAFILAVSGPMLTDNYPVGVASATLSTQYTSEAVAARTAAGDQNLQLLSLPTDDGSRGYGCDYHPSKATHRWMADQISSALKARLGW